MSAEAWPTLPLRLRNVSYALPRLLAMLVTSVLVFGGELALLYLGWLAATVGLLVLGFLLALAVAEGLWAAWWVEIGDRGLRVRTLFRTQQFDWPDVREIRPGAMSLLDVRRLFRQKSIVFAMGRHRQFVVYVGPRGQTAVADRLGPRWSEKTFAGRSYWHWLAVPLTVMLIVALWVLANLVMVYLVGP